MDIGSFDFHLPPERVAQYPAQKRDGSRLLVVRKSDGRAEHRHFFDLPDYIRSGDVLVLNNSKVIHARLIGVKASTGALVELFLIGRHARAEGSAPQDAAALSGQTADGRTQRLSLQGDSARSGTADGRIGDARVAWDSVGTADIKVLARPAKRLKPGDIVTFGEGLDAEILNVNEDGSRLARFHWSGSFSERIERLGNIPLPPYIRREAERSDELRYQTVYAETPGSAAAPTAGLHFTKELLGRLREKGAILSFVTLHVGLGTFLPVKAARIEDHTMHSEHFCVGADAARAINAAKREGRRVICVGTTAVRTVETAALRAKMAHLRTRTENLPAEAKKNAASEGNPTHILRACEGTTDIFIRPGSQFRVTDGLLTNFHLPKSTLLMLVSAFYDRENVLRLYGEAIREGYRFFSYGDAMLIL
ncbi:MAG: tRNA preQ1(34) S-adenosylmethionine ribosyltransferase-isomerase QueA [Clostridiales Family XIII bacterium]|jgi:S-adenosylmethionine:tRNA ribosyltransferase-isomerase|nr:tRNA preQ1(34) S-adenosylmethionine ribosyltransferase-isomerase QueA [Clostridiales Family XIII bacterium]